MQNKVNSLARSSREHCDLPSKSNKENSKLRKMYNEKSREQIVQLPRLKPLVGGRSEET